MPWKAERYELDGIFRCVLSGERALRKRSSRIAASVASCYFRAFSIAASASGAITLKPAAFGCSPSSARSFFSIPLSSTSAEK